MARKSSNDVTYFVGDFETTVYDNQQYTEVWASALVNLDTEDELSSVLIHHSIGETFEYLLSLKRKNIVVYYHNLKFDGEFWLSYLMVTLGYKQALEKTGAERTDIAWLENKDMPRESFKYCISDMGQWYSLTIRTKHGFIELRDSLKLLPFSVKKIGKSFGTKHHKLDMDYKGFRYAGCEITDEEKQYIANDVLVVKEALNIMFSEGHDRLTIGGCCLDEFKKTIGKDDYKILFPKIYEYEIDEEIYGKPNAGEYVRKSYKGGWCYLVKGKEDKIYHNGTTADVNSLYPSVMSSESGCIYPLGEPHFWSGNYIPDDALGENRYYFVRIKTRFYLKENMLPCIQIKGNALYRGTEWLESSDIVDEDGNHHIYYTDLDGSLKDTRVTLTLTMTDYILIKEHYDLLEFEILDGCWFYAEAGVFDTYINKYKKIKMESKGARRELAKLFLNNLYGKMATNTDSSSKLAYIKDDKTISYDYVYGNDKKPGYIPIGSAITSYARDFTIRTAQKNYYGKNKRGFIYADTDSIHCDLLPEEIKGIRVSPNDFCCWKLEGQWDTALFVRQKTYIEHIVGENCEPVEPHFDVKCAGMPDRCKHLFEWSMSDWCVSEELTKDEVEFLNTERTLSDFKRGLIVPSKLLPKRIKGGIVLMDTTYEMR